MMKASFFIVIGLVSFLVGVLVGTKCFCATNPEVAGHVDVNEDVVSDEENSMLKNTTAEREAFLALKAKALAGDLNSALDLFNFETYSNRNYLESFYWAFLAHKLGYESEFGSLLEVAEGNIRNEIDSLVPGHR